MQRQTYLGDVPGHRGVVKVIVDVVVNTAGHAMEEVGHALAPATGGTPDWSKTIIRGTYGLQRVTRANRSKDETKVAYQVQGASSSIWPRMSMRIMGAEARIFL